MKKNEEQIVDNLELSTEELIAKVVGRQKRVLNKRGKVAVALCCLIPLCFVLTGVLHSVRSIDSAEGATLSMLTAPISATAAKKDLISIPAGTVKANPFLPYRDIGGSSMTDVPKFDIVEPPEVVNEASEAARLMDTIVSGILYDKYSPSAILNIEGNDYLVKKGDTVNNYKVLNITQDSVTVKLGGNTFKAGIGEILTEGSVNHNNVSNLNKKFGGESR